MAHDDDDPVLVGYSASRNASFQGTGDELGFTWGQWRAMNEEERSAELTNYLWGLVDLYVEDDE